MSYYNTTAAEFSIYNELDETPMMMAGDCIQTLEVEARYLDGKVALRGGTEGVAGDMVPHALITETSFTKNGRTYLTNGLYCLNHVEWYSDNETVAEVNDGTVRAKRCGNATITAQQQVASIAASIDFQVEHIEEEVPAKPPTCTETGLTDGIVCSVCGEVIIPQETVPETGHKWNSGAVTKNPTLEEEGIITYTCSVCEAQKTQNIPKLIDLSDAEVGVVSAMTYTGKALKPEITVTLDGTELTEGADYTVTYSNNINVGTAAVKVTGKGSYAGAVNKTFKIKGISIANATVSGISNKAYTGSAITQNPTVKVGGKTLVKGTDYTLSYANNINAGTATVTITGKGTYASKKTVSFRINKAACSITAKAAATSVAVGKTTTVSITGAKGTKSFVSSSTAIATVSSAGTVTARKVGTVRIRAVSAATSNYKAASNVVTINVVPAATTSLKGENLTTGIKLTWKTVTGANGYKIYRDSTLIKTITSGSTLTYADTKANTNGTQYTYKVVAKGTTGDSTLSRSRVICRLSRPAVSSVTNTAASRMTVKWGKNAKATGYQIQYSLSSSFALGNKTATITAASTVSKVIGSLTKGKTYYVRIRTYKTVGSNKYWSAWSAAKNVKISK
ncbi:MAG: Ig-like domain-containing protein [Lachnospiraceae bacterium]|nr:Ig-like domain-containing protein [Lachnospiraceae bacterium]